MLLERIKTSPLLPKILFGATVALITFAASIAYAFIAVDPQTIIEESARVTDQLTYKVIINGGN